LLDYKARWYSPALGRFTQPDSIVPEPGNPQAWNRYSYTLNNPVKYKDPTGHCVDAATVAFCAVGGGIPVLGPIIIIGVIVTVLVVANSDGPAPPPAYVQAALAAESGATVEGEEATEGSIAGSETGQKPKIEEDLAIEGEITLSDHAKENLEKRGWTEEEALSVANNPTGQYISEQDNRNTGAEVVINLGENPGDYVAVDTSTGEVIQVNDRNKPDWKMPKPK
jgi:hypothetical protein